jgi:hypothetical protein
MRSKKVFGFCIVLFAAFFSSACFTIEKEIFLNADGSGDLVLRISMPDLPEKTNAAAPGVPQKSATEEIDKFKKEVMTSLPPTMKLKEAKQVKQNGIISFYAVLEFKDLKDTEVIFAKLGQNDLNELSPGSASEWQAKLEKKDGKTVYSESILMDMDQAKPSAKASPDAPPSPKPAAPATQRAKGGQAPGKSSKGANKPPPPGFVSAKEPDIEDGAKDFAEQLKPLFLAMVNMRFVLHAPSPITESNADIVLHNNRIAVWNCSLVKFATEKKPIEMRAIF